MLILCNGHAKSGSSFVYQLIEAVVTRTGYAQPEIRRHFLPSSQIPRPAHPYFADFAPGDVASLCRDLPTGVLMVVKTHSPLTPDMAELLKQGKLKVVYTYRNPRDAAVSLRDSARREEHLPVTKRRFLGIDTNLDAIQVMANRISHATHWLRNDSVLTIHYQEIVDAPFDLAQRIMTYLGLQVDIIPFLKEHLLNKQRIQEFNVGISGRHVSNFDLLEEGLCDTFFSKFEQEFLVEKGTPDFLRN